MTATFIAYNDDLVEIQGLCMKAFLFSLFLCCSVANAQGVSLQRYAQDDLVTVLQAKDLANFKANLGEFSPPFLLRSGSVYYEANNSSYTGASALVVDPNGYYYAAYKTPYSDAITYITNDANCTEEPHDAIKLFSSRFKDNPKIVYSESLSKVNGVHTCQNVFGNNQEVKKNDTRSAETRSVGENETQRMARKSAETIWGFSTVSRWNMNNGLMEVLGKAINDIRVCSKNFSLVPKPPAYGTIPGPVYFMNYGIQVINYNTRLKNSKSYLTCVSTTALKYRTSAELASAGL